MKNVGIISEFNPFHKGHEYLVKKVREEVDDDVCIIAVMSGDFVQRGHLALMDKWKRAEAAISCGVDLVLELPVWASCAGAEIFAEGSVGLLDKAANIDYLAFGAEAESLADLDKAAETFAFETPEFSAAIKAELEKGSNFARARAEAAVRVFGLSENVINRPNNILAIEYLKQLKKRSSDIKPIMINRKESGYFEGSGKSDFAGAGWIREQLKEGQNFESIAKFLPENSYNILKSEKLLFMESAYGYIIYKLLTMSSDEAQQIDGAFEGLENRTIKAALNAIDYESLVNGIKTKRYARTTVERFLSRMMIGITKKDAADFRHYDKICTRVLAFNETGASYLRSIKKNESIKCITNVSKEWPDDEVLSRMTELDVRAAQLYSLISGECAGIEIKKHGLFRGENNWKK